MALACILVLKYRKGDEDSLMEKISKLNIHSIIKKSNRVSSHLKHLTGFAPQVRPMLAGPACLTVLQGPEDSWRGLAQDRTWCLFWFCQLVEIGPAATKLLIMYVHRGK